MVGKKGYTYFFFLFNIAKKSSSRKCNVIKSWWLWFLFLFFRSQFCFFFNCLFEFQTIYYHKQNKMNINDDDNYRLHRGKTTKKKQNWLINLIDYDCNSKKNITTTPTRNKNIDNFVVIWCDKWNSCLWFYH